MLSDSSSHRRKITRRGDVTVVVAPTTIYMAIFLTGRSYQPGHRGSAGLGEAMAGGEVVRVSFRYRVVNSKGELPNRGGGEERGYFEVRPDEREAEPVAGVSKRSR